MKTLQEPGSILSPIANRQSPIQNPCLEMREQTTDPAVAYAVALLSHYGFELRGYTAEELVNLWLRNYQANWVRLGVIEALYQGRYKAVSVEQILAVWARRGQPIYRFNHEFERLISRKLPQSLTARHNTARTDLSQEISLPPLSASYPDTTDEPAMLEKPTIEQASTATQDTPPPAKTVLQDLTEAPVKSDEQLPEPLTNASTSLTYDADWSRCEVSKQPIHQFTPPPDASDFYLKLKAVLQQEDLTQSSTVTPIVDEPESQPPQSRSEKN